MNEHREDDPLDALHAADPVDEDHLPPASLARIRARVMEDVMARPEQASRRGPFVASLGAGAVVAIAALAFVYIGGPGPSPTLQPEPTGGIRQGGVISASCVETYDPETLANRERAFDGTVSDIEGDRVTFEVNEAYKGVTGDSITLDAPGMTGDAITSAGGPRFAIGERYLVAGDSTYAWACGFSQAFDAAVAARWADVFGA